MVMKKRLLYIINPTAGRGQIRQVLLDILDLLCRCGYEVQVSTTSGPGQAPGIVCDNAEKTDLIICSGGDGTMDEVVEGVLKSKKDIPIGYIPSGSTNDFANSLFIPKDPLAAARNIMEGNLYKCDVGRFNEHYFIYVAAFGLFTDVAYQTPQDWKKMLGHMAYVLEGAMKLFDIRSFSLKIEANGKTMEGNYLYGMITNSRSIGGIRNITRDVDMNDGLFEVTLIEMPRDPSELQKIVTAFVMQEDESEFVHTFKTDKLRIESFGECPWTLDGEYGGNPDLVEIENIHEAFTLVLTSTKE